MKCVILASPYQGRGWFPWWDRFMNVVYARKCMRDCLLRDEAPFASHLLYTQRGVLRDNRPTERERGIRAEHAWISKAAHMVVYIDRGISKGMELDIREAKKHNKVVYYRRLINGLFNDGTTAPP